MALQMDFHRTSTAGMRPRATVAGNPRSNPSKTPLRVGRRRINVQCAVIVPPSSRPAASELQALAALSKIVPDTVQFEAHSDVRPQAATVSFSLMRSAISSEMLGMRPFENAVAAALNWDGCKQVPPGEQHLVCQLDKAMVNLGALLAPQVEGRVAVEVDPRIANDTGAIVSRVQHLVQLFKDVNVPSSKIIFRVPGTWPAIQAAKQLEAQGVATQVFLVFSLVQGVAAAQARVSVVQPNVGRVREWYRRHPGVVRDPKGPREDSGAESTHDMGLDLVTQMYTYIKKYHPSTQIMASGLRTKEDALALAGCDYLVLADKVLEALGATQTTQGFNDGFSAVDAPVALEPELSPQAAANADIEQMPPITEAEFKEQMAKNAGQELLDVALTGLLHDVESILPYFHDGYAIGQSA